MTQSTKPTYTYKFISVSPSPVTRTVIEWGFPPIETVVNNDVLIVEDTKTQERILIDMYVMLQGYWIENYRIDDDEELFAQYLETTKFTLPLDRHSIARLMKDFANTVYAEPH